MSKLLLIIPFLFINSLAKAYYDRLPLGKLIEVSEYAVVGEIIGQTENHFQLRIDSNLFGGFKFDTVSILTMHDYPMEWRSYPYRIGKKEIVFLTLFIVYQLH